MPEKDLVLLLSAGDFFQFVDNSVPQKRSVPCGDRSVPVCGPVLPGVLGKDASLSRCLSVGLTDGATGRGPPQRATKRGPLAGLGGGSRSVGSGGLDLGSSPPAY